MRHAVLMIVYNNLELTKDAVASVLAQDIGPLDLTIIDNGSTDGTGDWLREFFTDDASTIWKGFHSENRSPIKIVNQLLPVIFGRGHTKVLGVPNDVVLPPNFYRELERWPRGIITASMTSERSFPMFEESKAVSENTPLAAGIVRKWAHDALVDRFGYLFDEGFFHYASDCDLALRMAACGIRGIQLDIQFWHHGSASWRLAPEAIGRAITNQADVDRSYFFKKWGFGVADPAYGEMAGDINFRGERIDG